MQDWLWATQISLSPWVSKGESFSWEKTNESCSVIIVLNKRNVWTVTRSAGKSLSQCYFHLSGLAGYWHQGKLPTFPFPCEMWDFSASISRTRRLSRQRHVSPPGTRDRAEPDSGPGLGHEPGAAAGARREDRGTRSHPRSLPPHSLSAHARGPHTRLPWHERARVPARPRATPTAASHTRALAHEVTRAVTRTPTRSRSLSHARRPLSPSHSHSFSHSPTDSHSHSLTHTHGGKGKRGLRQRRALPPGGCGGGARAPLPRRPRARALALAGVGGAEERRRERVLQPRRRRAPRRAQSGGSGTSGSRRPSGSPARPGSSMGPSGARWGRRGRGAAGVGAGRWVPVAAGRSRAGGEGGFARPATRFSRPSQPAGKRWWEAGSRCHPGRAPRPGGGSGGAACSCGVRREEPSAGSGAGRAFRGANMAAPESGKRDFCP